eukprot:m.74835 g.74835  ORF g.74835 m.74835 type:complete len:145 (+) comp20463_c1_seq4:105-539(+)
MDQIELVEEFDENFEPSELTMFEYAAVLDLDPNKDSSHFWIAREGLKARLPPGWKVFEDSQTGDIYYFNMDTGESSWEHPSDAIFKDLLEEERKIVAKREKAKKEAMAEPARQVLPPISKKKPAHSKKQKGLKNTVSEHKKKKK